MTNKLVIIGLGPAGLTAAYKALQKGYQVTALTNREAGEYLRPQRIKLTDSTVAFLKSIVDVFDEEDQKFIRELSLVGTSSYSRTVNAKIKDIERFLWRKVGDSVRVIDCTEAKLEDVDITEKKVLVKDENGKTEEIDFDYLLGADGLHRETTGLVNTKLDEDKKIKYNEMEFGLNHPYHFTASLKVLAEDAVRVQEHQLNEKKLMESLSEMRWVKKRKPTFFIFSNSSKTKFYVNGELPESIAMLSDVEKRQAVLAWASTIVSEETGLNESCFFVKASEKEYAEKKDRLKATVFKVGKFGQADKASLYLSAKVEGGVYAHIGDAYKTPYYVVSHGLNDGISSAQAYVESLPDVGGRCLKFSHEVLERQCAEDFELMATRLKQRHRYFSIPTRKILRDLLDLIKKVIDLFDKSPESFRCKSKNIALIDQLKFYYTYLHSCIIRVSDPGLDEFEKLRETVGQLFQSLETDLVYSPLAQSYEMSHKGRMAELFRTKLIELNKFVKEWDLDQYLQTISRPTC